MSYEAAVPDLAHDAMMAGCAYALDYQDAAWVPGAIVAVGLLRPPPEGAEMGAEVGAEGALTTLCSADGTKTCAPPSLLRCVSRWRIRKAWIETVGRPPDAASSLPTPLG